MMEVLLLNLRELWKKQRLFFVLLVLVQAICAFCLVFVIGLILNNQLYTDMDFLDDTFYVTFNGTVLYEELEDTVKDIFERTLKGAAHSLRMHADDQDLMVWTDVAIENGRYVYGPFLREMLQPQLASGRAPTEEELNSEACVAVAQETYGFPLKIRGETYEVIGLRMDGAGVSEQAFVGPKKLFQLPLRDLQIRLNRYLSQPEIDAIAEAFDRVIPGKYTIEKTGEAQGEGDTRAVLRAVILSCVLVGIVLAGTMTILYQHILDKRRYKLAVFRLTGCGTWKAVQYLLAEMTVVSAPSLALGLGSFYALQKWKLEMVYPYMRIYLDGKLYFALFFGMLLLLLFFMLLLTAAAALRPVKQQLLAARE